VLLELLLQPIKLMLLLPQFMLCRDYKGQE